MAEIINNLAFDCLYCEYRIVGNGPKEELEEMFEKHNTTHQFISSVSNNKENE